MDITSVNDGQWNGRASIQSCDLREEGGADGVEERTVLDGGDGRRPCHYSSEEEIEAWPECGQIVAVEVNIERL